MLRTLRRPSIFAAEERMMEDFRDIYPGDKEKFLVGFSIYPGDKRF